MSMCRVVSCVVGGGCLLWPACSVGKTLLAFALLHCVLQGQTCLLLRYILTSYFCIPVTYDKNNIFFLVLFLEGLHRTIQLQLLQRYWLGHRLGLLWYWMVCLESTQKSFWDCTQVLHFGLFCWLWGYISSKGFLPTVVDIMVIWIKFAHSGPF